ncbi:uncharacterized protein LAJ45_11755 [Morchella importuna]|nr:uncharacterized protein LAJ45_11755 [Morchella importuna]KAH8144271.1 hypothetical protein LAJ45_11755 [Morchella importuna]
MFRATTRLMRPFGKRLLEEPHPFFIYPKTVKAQPVQLKFYTTRLARAASMYLPMYVVFFGWPFAAQALVTATGGP